MRRPKKKGPSLAKGIHKALNPYVDEALALSSAFVEEARERFDARGLDYRIDSVRILDRLCRFNREAFDDGLILKAGFYFGEMLRRAYKGKYLWDGRANALSLRIGDLTLYPIEKVRKSISEREETPLEEYIMVLAKKIADHRERESGGASG